MTMSNTFTFPDPKMIALGGVATGNMNAIDLTMRERGRERGRGGGLDGEATKEEVKKENM